MSIKVMQWVWENSRAKNSARIVLLAIADCASDDGGNAWPSIATIAAKAGLSVRSTQYAINELVAIGELEVDQQAGPRGVNRYRATMRAADQERPKRGSLAVDARTREKVFKRDGRRCRHCGTSENLQIDHIVPVSKLGSNKMSNLQTLCATCNRTKGTGPDKLLQGADIAGVQGLQGAVAAPHGVQKPVHPVQILHPSGADAAPVTVLEPTTEPSVEPSATRTQKIPTKTVIELAAFFTEAVPISNTHRVRSVIAKALGAGITPEHVRDGLRTLIAEGRGCTEDTLRIALQPARGSPVPGQRQSTADERVAQGLALAAKYAQAEQAEQRREITK